MNGRARRKLARDRLGCVGVLARLDQHTGGIMPRARFAQASDLERLLDLFRAPEVSSTVQLPDRAEQIWSETLPQRSGRFCLGRRCEDRGDLHAYHCAQSSAQRTWTWVSRKCGDARRVPWAGTWSRSRSGCSHRGLGNQLLPRPTSKRPQRSSGSSLL